MPDQMTILAPEGMLGYGIPARSMEEGHHDFAHRGPVWLEHYRALLRVLVRLRPSDHQRSKFLDFRNRVLKVVRA